MRLYHATCRINQQSIERTGLDPRQAFGNRQAVYLVDFDRINYAIAHAASRHGWRVNQMVLLSALVDEADVRRTNQAGVFYCTKRVFVDPAYSVLVQEIMLKNEDEIEREVNRDSNHRLQEPSADSAL